MADRFVHPGLATGNNDGTTWADAWRSWDEAGLITDLTTTTNRLVVKYNASSPKAGALTLTGPSSGAPKVIISADGSGTSVTYTEATASQIATSGANDITFDGSFALYGMRLASGRHFLLSNDGDELGYYENTTFVMSANGRFTNIGITSGNAKTRFINCTIDLDADSSAASTSVIESATGTIEFVGPTFANGDQRTGRVIEQNANGSFISCVGVDFSSFTSATTIELFRYWNAGFITLTNCKMKDGYVLAEAANGSAFGSIMAVNCWHEDRPQALHYEDAAGTVRSSVPVRTGGATVEGAATAWLVTTRASVASEDFPLYTPWIYGLIGTTGSKTFTVAIANDTESFDDSEVRLEVEILGSADSALATRIGGRTAAEKAAGTTNGGWGADSGSWTGTGAPSTHKQLLTATGTVNEAGLYRARVAVGKASVSGLYIDPKVTVT